MEEVEKFSCRNIRSVSLVFLFGSSDEVHSSNSVNVCKCVELEKRKSIDVFVFNFALKKNETSLAFDKKEINVISLRIISKKKNW